MASPHVLLLKGWHQSAPAAFATWAHEGARTVAQHDWVRPLRGDWLMQLETAVLAAPAEVQLVAHGLACWLVASWAQVSQHTAAVRGAWLIDPLHVQTPECQVQLPSWQRIAVQALPFEAAVFTDDGPPTRRHDADPLSRHTLLARAWGASHHPHLPTALAHGPDLCTSKEHHGH